ncbi:MAG: hypothetical protein Q7W02_03690 [Candidatus Rokubacteria bacterium]|nr:hypothetical protein [Candidatus Rokubacteria bacterium]
MHCGESTDGVSLATLVAVDLATTWTALQAVWGLHHRRVPSGIHLLRQRLPVPLRAWHSDHGGECLTACLVAWCRREGIRVTRGRPYRTNDQAWVEPRDGLLVRTRRSTRRVGSTVVTQYDAPRTPCHRMLLSGVPTEAQRQALAQPCQALDPIALARDSQLTLDLLWTLADIRPRWEAARGSHICAASPSPFGNTYF